MADEVLDSTSSTSSGEVWGYVATILVRGIVFEEGKTGGKVKIAWWEFN